MPLKIGCIVRSRAGRDKDMFLCVVGVDGDRVLLCDGKERPLENPKKKNTKHITLTSCVLDSEKVKTNKSLRHALRDYITCRKGDE